MLSSDHTVGKRGKEKKEEKGVWLAAGRRGALGSAGLRWAPLGSAGGARRWALGLAGWLAVRGAGAAAPLAHCGALGGAV